MEKVLKVAVMLAAIDKMSSVIEKASNSGIKSLTRLNKEAGRISKSAFDFGKNAAGFGMGFALPLAGMVNAAADVESMQVSLKTAFQGNEAAANKAYKTINDFAAKTPYQLEEVMGGFIKLKNMGLDPSTDALTAYGNTASAMGKSLNDMIEAVADAATGEFERLKEFGIKAKQQGDYVTFTFRGVETTVKKDSKQIELYLKNIGNTQFAGGIEAQSKTFKGQLSTMMDNVKMFAASIGKVLLPALIELFKKLQPILESVQKWTQKHPTLTRYIIYGTAAIVALSFAVSALSFVFGALMKIVQAVTWVTKVFTYATKVSTMALRFFNLTVQYGSKVLQFMRGVILGAINNINMLTLRTKIQTIFHRIWNMTVMFGTNVMKIFQVALMFVGNTMRFVGMIFKMNPIILIITIIIGLVYALIKAWRPIMNFFKWLWDGIKNIFKSFWDWLTGWITKPVKMLIDSWDKIKGYFKALWDAVKKPFVDFWNWLTGLGKKFMQAGANLVNSIWNGIKDAFNKLIEGWKALWKTVREYLPFSPAKRGPLKDIHRVKLVETIAESVKHEPMTKAMHRVTAKVKGMVPKQTGLAGQGVVAGAMGGAGARGSGAGIVVNFNPTINLTGGTGQDRQDFLALLKKYEPDLLRIIKEAMDRQDRKNFA